MVATGDNQFPHLPFERIREGRARFPSSPRGTATRQQAAQRNRPAHVAQLNRSLDQLRAYWARKEEERATTAPPLPEGHPLVVVVEEGTDLDFLRSSFGFEIISESTGGYVLVLAEDTDLSQFSETLDKFTQGTRGGGSAAKLYELCETSEERLKRVLSPGIYDHWGQIRDDQTRAVDISIGCAGTCGIPKFDPKGPSETHEHYAVRCQRHGERHRVVLEAWDQLIDEREALCRQFIDNYGGEVTDIFQDGSHGIFSLPDCFTVRAAISGKCLRDLAENYPHLFEIAEIEDSETSFGDPAVAGGYGPVPLAPDANAPAVCIIDSGIQEDHVLLQPAVLKAESKCFIPGESQTDTADYVTPSGHGTRVAGALLYPGGILDASDAAELPCWVHNARVLDRNCQIPSSLMPALYMERIVGYYSDSHRDRPVRIFNHSINSRAPYRSVHMSTWGAAIDKLSYQKDILVVQSAGNVPPNSLNPLTLGIAQHLNAGRTYPDYLQEPSCRLRNPAQSLNALTVGSISPATWEGENQRSIASEKHPSAFSPSGPGIWNSVKPDVVEVGGDFAHNDTSPVLLANKSELSLNLPRSTMHSPGAAAQDAVGTSFAAPRVSHIAAMLEGEFPDESCLLYRALIANSARWPSWAEAQEDSFAVIRQLGYGVPDLERATRNTEHRVTLISAGGQRIPAREAHTYHVRVPEQLRSPEEDFLIRIDVTLSYAAMPRRTRRHHRGYLTTWLDWVVCKQGQSLESFCSEIFRDDDLHQDGDSIFRWMLRERSNWGEIEGISRQNGTLQKDWCYVRSHELPPDFCIAVRGHVGWDPSPEAQAKYALAVSFEAVNEDLHVYQHVQSAIESTIAVEARERIEITELEESHHHPSIGP